MFYECIAAMVIIKPHHKEFAHLVNILEWLLGRKSETEQVSM